MTRRGWLDRQMDRAEKQMAVWKQWEEGDTCKPPNVENGATPSGRLELVSASQKGEGNLTAKGTSSGLD